LNDPKTVALVFVTPDFAPQAEETEELVDRLRADVIPAAIQGGDSVAYVSGLTAAFTDIGDRIMERLPLFLLYIIGVTFVVLAMAFRSIVVSLTAVAVNLLSVGAAYGLLVLVFQEGVGADLLGFGQVDRIEAWVPVFLFSVLFGLSMDYQVFLLSRIRERYTATGDTNAAIIFGVGSTARRLTAPRSYRQLPPWTLAGSASSE
jgi:RND superfamily putative drug exporter